MYCVSDIGGFWAPAWRPDRSLHFTLIVFILLLMYLSISMIL
jgi:hypothetical protein